MGSKLPGEVLTQFQTLYDQNLKVYQKCKPVLIQDLENVLQGCNVGHVPVHATVKSWNRASKTAERRYQERKKMNEIWRAIKPTDQDEYCAKWDFDRDLGEAFDKRRGSLSGYARSTRCPNRSLFPG